MADDLAAVTSHLDLNNAIHIGHSTGGGEVVHYLARHARAGGEAAILCAVPPLMVKTPANPNGLPKEVFDGFQTALAANRSQFYRDVASGPFYGYNRPGAKPSEPVIQNWWRQGMNGAAPRRITTASLRSPQTDFTEDLKKIDVPVLVMHSEDDQIVPYVAAVRCRPTSEERHPQNLPGVSARHADHRSATINADLLAFIKG